MSDFSPKGKPGITIFFLLLLSPFFSKAQITAQDTLKEVTLQAAIDYAIKHQPKIQQSLLDEQITASNIKANWPIGTRRLILIITCSIIFCCNLL